MYITYERKNLIFTHLFRGSWPKISQSIDSVSDEGDG